MRDPVSGADPYGDQGSTVFDLLAGTFGTLYVRTFGTRQRDRPCAPGGRRSPRHHPQHDHGDERQHNQTVSADIPLVLPDSVGQHGPHVPADITRRCRL